MHVFVWSMNGFRTGWSIHTYTSMFYRYTKKGFWPVTFSSRFPRFPDEHEEAVHTWHFFRCGDYGGRQFLIYVGGVWTGLGVYLLLKGRRNGRRGKERHDA